jgi:hypothetical protein
MARWFGAHFPYFPIFLRILQWALASRKLHLWHGGFCKLAKRKLQWKLGRESAHSLAQFAQFLPRPPHTARFSGLLVVLPTACWWLGCMRAAFVPNDRAE